MPEHFRLLLFYEFLPTGSSVSGSSNMIPEWNKRRLNRCCSADLFWYYFSNHFNLIMHFKKYMLAHIGWADFMLVASQSVRRKTSRNTHAHTPTYGSLCSKTFFLLARHLLALPPHFIHIDFYANELNQNRTHYKSFSIMQVLMLKSFHQIFNALYGCNIRNSFFIIIFFLAEKNSANGKSKFDRIVWIARAIQPF